MDDAEAAHQYRRAQARTILNVFEAENGHPPHTVEELAQWAKSPKGKASLTHHRLRETEKIKPTYDLGGDGVN